MLRETLALESTLKYPGKIMDLISLIKLMILSYSEDVLCPFPERVLLYGKYLSASPQPPELFSSYLS